MSPEAYFRNFTVLFVYLPKILHKHYLQFILVVTCKMASRESENNTYANYWGDKQRAVWCVMVFSVVVNRVVSVENIGLKPDCDIYADDVIAFCLYLMN